MILYSYAIIFLLYRKLHSNHYVNAVIDASLLSYIHYVTNTYSYPLTY